MSGCYTCGGFGMHHDPVAHDAEMFAHEHDWYGEQWLWNEDAAQMQWRQVCDECNAVKWSDRLVAS